MRSALVGPSIRRYNAPPVGATDGEKDGLQEFEEGHCGHALPGQTPLSPDNAVIVHLSECISRASPNIPDFDVVKHKARQSQDKVIPDSFRIILNHYPKKAEAKSLAPDGSPCIETTREYQSDVKNPVSRCITFPLLIAYPRAFLTGLYALRGNCYTRREQGWRILFSPLARNCRPTSSAQESLSVEVHPPSPSFTQTSSRTLKLQWNGTEFFNELLDYGGYRSTAYR
jgi:hypothetical protein